MSNINDLLKQQTAGEQIIGFDYQFYYFIYLALQLRTGQKIGFEVKDDIHIDLVDGNTVLLQAKHSVVTNTAGEIKNLSTSDLDLWKSLSNWCVIIKADKNNQITKNHSYILVTNKNNNDNNDFLVHLKAFRESKDISNLLYFISQLQSKTTNDTLKKYLKNVLSIGKRRATDFFLRVSIETGVDDVIGLVKEQILHIVRSKKFVEPVFESLIANIVTAKYTDIKSRQKFEFTFEDFNAKFASCFRPAFDSSALPKRELKIQLPPDDDLENQLFVKQLVDIGGVTNGDKEIREYTIRMLKFINHFDYWTIENFLLPQEADDFLKEVNLIWSNQFRAKYRRIMTDIASGTTAEDLENDIKELALELYDAMMEKNLSVPGYSPFGLEFSNGCYYSLSNNLEIGWHLNWEQKYSKP